MTTMRACILIAALALLGCRRREPPVVVARVLYSPPPSHALGDKIVEEPVEPMFAEQVALLRSAEFRERAVGKEPLDVEVRHIRDSSLLELVFRDRDEARAMRMCREFVGRYVGERATTKGRVSVIDPCARIVLELH